MSNRLLGCPNPRAIPEGLQVHHEWIMASAPIGASIFFQGDGRRWGMTSGIKLSPLELLEKLAALVPLPRVHLVRYAGCLAPHSKLRDPIIPTPCQQGVDGEETKTGTPYWNSATAW